MEDGLVNNLPDEVLLEVFSYFDGKSLKNLMFVCKRWFRAISKHAATMRRLPVDFRRLLVTYKGGVILHRYHTLNVEHINFGSDLHASLLGCLGHSVQVLNIGYCVLNGFHLRTLLENLVHLNSLTITKSRMNEDAVMCAIEVDDDAQVIELRKLKLMHINYGVLKHLFNVQVSELEIVDANNYKINHEHLVEFILNQKSLRVLIVEELNNNVNSIFLTEDLTRASFRLKHFSGLFCTNLARHEFFNDNLISFMSLHAKSLRTLRITGSSLSPDTYKFAISSLKCLTSLEINPSSIPQENNFFRVMPQNTLLKTLKLGSTITRENFHGFSHMLHHYPDINDLTLLDTDEFVANDLFYTVARELKSLSNLSVLNLNSNFSPSHKIHSLNSFCIKILNDFEQFLKFIALNDNLEKISVGWIQRDFSEEAIEKIISQPRSLTSLKLSGRFIASKRVYDTISRDYKNLRTLELVVNNYDEVKNLRFVFPLDRRNYIQSKCLYFEEFCDREPLND